MRVLVTWADSKSANMGVRAVAAGMAELARMAWGAETEVDFQNYVKGDSAITIGRKSMLADFWRRSGPIAKKLRRYDVILDSGAGDGFTDIYGLKRRLSVMVYLSRKAHSLGIPIVMGPQTIGPFTTKIGRGRAKPYMDRCSAVISRDGASTAFAAELGHPVDVQSTDVVFALEGTDVAKSRDVILNVSGLLWFPNPHVDSNRYQEQVSDLVQILESRGRTITLLSHVTTPVSATDDLAAIYDLQRRLGSEREVLVPEDLSTAREHLATAQVVIGARMHACLNAISMGIPAIPWAYSRKFAPLLHDLGWTRVTDLRGSADTVDVTLDYLEPNELEAAAIDVDRVRRAARRKLVEAAEVMRSAVPGRAA